MLVVTHTLFTDLKCTLEKDILSMVRNIPFFHFYKFLKNYSDVFLNIYGGNKQGFYVYMSFLGLPEWYVHNLHGWGTDYLFSHSFRCRSYKIKYDHSLFLLIFRGMFYCTILCACGGWCIIFFSYYKDTSSTRLQTWPHSNLISFPRNPSQVWSDVEY